MKTPNPIQIFKPGKHTAMSGVALSFSESDLAATVAAYDPALHEAPLVVGHPKGDAPRFGGVGSLSYADGILDASPRDVVPEFAEWVNKKLFNKVSASFYTPDSPQNPVPGVYYLRHVGFLGAQPPAIKGLNPNGISFSDAEEGVVEFGDWDDRNNAGLWRGLREWLIGKFGLDEADKALPKWDVQLLADSAAQPEIVEPAPITNFTEGDEMSAEEKARLATLEAENATLKASQVAFAEAEKARVRSATHASHLAFSERLIKEGKLLPAQHDVAVATLDFMAGQDAVVEFGEGDAKQPLLEAFKTFLQALPKQVEFGELGNGEIVAGDNDDANDIVRRALEFQEVESKAGRDISIVVAVNHVTKDGK